MVGKFFSTKIEKKLSRKVISNSIRFDEKRYINPLGEFGDYINHSCSPNCIITKENGKLWVVSLRRLSKNSEILIDYSTIMAKDDDWSMKCNCGTEYCRNNILKFGLLPEKLQKKYIKLGAVPIYILKSFQSK